MAQEKSWLRFALKKVVELLLEVKWIRLASKTIDDGLYLRKTYTDKLKHEFNLKFNREYRYEYYLKLDIGCSAQQLCFNPETSETLTSLCHKTRLIRDARLSDCSETGYPNVSLDAVIAYNAGAVRALFAAVGLSQEELDKYLLPTIRRVAAMVHLLPASGGYHHKECGGFLNIVLRLPGKPRKTVRELISPTILRIPIRQKTKGSGFWQQFWELCAMTVGRSYPMLS